MQSFTYLVLFIISIHASGSKINDTEVSTISLTKETFVNTTTLETTIIPSVTIELSTTILGQHHNSLQPLDSSTLTLFSVSIPSSSTSSEIGNPSTFLSSTQLTKGLETSAITSNNAGYLNITSQAGTHAYLPCNVKQLVNRPVSWIRIRDGHILTVDQTTFIGDERFQSIYTQNPERWSLQIKYVQIRDAGSYECQVSTEPKMSFRVQLNIIKPKTKLLGEKIRHVKAGSRVVLRCIVIGALEPPLFINWFFDGKQIFLHNKNSWQAELDREISSNGNHNDRQNTIASLIIPFVTKKDSGNYTCSPSNSESITAVLHVLNGEYSASAITSGCIFRDQFYFRMYWMILCLFSYFILLSIT